MSTNSAQVWTDIANLLKRFSVCRSLSVTAKLNALERYFATLENACATRGVTTCTHQSLLRSWRRKVYKCPWLTANSSSINSIVLSRISEECSKISFSEAYRPTESLQIYLADNATSLVSVPGVTTVPYFVRVTVTFHKEPLEITQERLLYFAKEKLPAYSWQRLTTPSRSKSRTT